MATESDFDKLMEEQPEPTSFQTGFPWHTQFVVESGRDPNFRMGRQSIDQDKAELSGRVKVDGSDSIQKAIAGPLVEHDAPTGIVPSTLFTPFPRDIYGIDYEYVELIALAAIAAVFGAVSATLLTQD